MVNYIIKETIIPTMNLFSESILEQLVNSYMLDFDLNIAEIDSYSNYRFLYNLTSAPIIGH